MSPFSWANAEPGAVIAAGMATASSQWADRRMGVPLVGRSSGSGPLVRARIALSFGEAGRPVKPVGAGRAGRADGKCDSWTAAPAAIRIGAEIANRSHVPAAAPGPSQETPPMASLVKIGSLFLNLDQVLRVDDLFTRTREDKMVVHFSSGDEPLTLAGKEADDLRTWLNTIATNLHAAADPETDG